MNHILICYYHSQIFELCHNLKGFVMCLYIMILYHDFALHSGDETATHCGM
jgi:hypothetical protein